jgi:hypothetical protein
MKSALLYLKPLVISLCLLLVVSTQAAPAEEMQLTGRWKVKFTFAGRDDMNLIFVADAKGSGSFLLLDTANRKPLHDRLPGCKRRTIASAFRARWSCRLAPVAARQAP